jgi:hypothetical protein
MKKTILTLLFAAFSLSANAYDTYNVDGQGYNYTFNFYDKGENFGVEINKEIIPISSDNVYNKYHDPIFASAINWSKIITGNTSSPVTYSILGLDAVDPDNNYNAMAESLYVNVAESPYKVTFVNARINGYTVTSSPNREDFPTDGIILVGLGVDPEHPGWGQFTGFHPLYHGELPDFNSVITHEIMHSLGVTNYAGQFFKEQGDENFYFSKGAEDSLGIWDKNLRIYTGDMSAAFDSSKEVIPQRGMIIGKNEAFDVYKYSPYFVGEETLKVLAGEDNPDDAKAAIIANGGFVNYSTYYDSDNERPKVYGLPIHPSDGGKNPEPELSHLELHNSYMSHQSYRNWLIPMEAELAVLKDLGYNIPLRKFFGKSYYFDYSNTTRKVENFTSGYSEWDGSSYTGAPSTVTQGIGIHVYGNNYEINQQSDILSNGEGAIGARIEGSDNIYNLKSGHQIQTNGKENLGLAVTWGQNHEVNIENGSSITANGEDGIAASFDFGGNLFGAYQDAKGSYINYSAEFEYSMEPDIDIQHALVKELNVAGTLTGSKAAIYISDNAHVNEINILNGAQINGDIISEWNSIKSGVNAKVQWFDGEFWSNVNPEDESQRYFTNLNIANDFSGIINGKITGENETYNTLKLNNSGNLTVTGDTINVYTINNTGALNVNKVDLVAQNGNITGAGTINVANNGSLALDSNVTNIANTLNLGANSSLSTLNSETTEIDIAKLNAGTDSALSFDLGDKFKLTTSTGSAAIKQIRVDDDTMKAIEDGSSYDLFTGDEVLTLTGASNVYYDGKKYALSQSATDNTLLEATLTATGVELADAVGDSTTANYIVTEDALTKDIGTIQGESFTISGEDINVNGHNGLVIDGTINTDGTVLKTGIAGASDSNITMQNNGKLLVSAEDKDIVIGSEGEVALDITNSEVKFDTGNNTIDVQGSISGTGSNANNKLTFTGNEFRVFDVNNVTINSDATISNLFGTSTNTVMNMDGTVINVVKDSYLASDGTNTLNLNYSELNLANNQTTDINLAKMNVVDKNKLAIDIDLKNLTSDRFVFQNQADLTTGTNSGFVIENANLLNSNLAFTNEKYYIPFISSDYNNQNLLEGIEFSDRNLLTPIFKYKLGYTEDDTSGGFLLSRGSAKSYSSYNPAVMASPVAAQMGGYLTQLNSYDEAFRNMDMYMLMTAQQRQALKFKNKYAAADSGLLYDSTLLRQERAEGWFRPYATFEKVGLKNGPKVENQAYGTFVGGESQMYDLGHGWDGMWGAYVGYNGSHQNYDGVSIYQNGGTLGVVGMAYKGNFFTGLTLNAGASAAEASTMYGNEDFVMLMAGIASKTGYNWELANGKFIIQPSWLMSYSFVNTFDYTNAAGVRMHSSPLNAIQLQPELKFIGNLKNGWQPYASVAMVWNIMDDTKFKANDVTLPELSVKPYVKYGVGVRKSWGERFTGFFQTYLTNGGRNGVGLQAGFTWALGGGKDKKADEQKIQKSLKRVPELKKTEITLNGN